MINTTCIYFIFIIICALFGSAYYVHAEQTAIVVKSQNLSAYNEVLEGFRNECVQRNISIKNVYGLNGKMKTGKKIMHEVQKENPDIVLAIGVLAATVAKEKIRDIPVLFCMVINHERFQLTGHNITGIATEIAIEHQFKQFQSVLGTLRNIGVIYDSSKTGNYIKNAEIRMEQLGFHLIKYEITSSNKISEAMENLIGRIDALWLLPDSTVITNKSFSLIKATAIENKVPLLCTSDVFVKAGALAAVFSDYKSIGVQAAHLAEKILKPSAPGSLGIVNPDSFKLSINTGTAEKLGLDLKTIQEKPFIIMYP